MVTLDPDIESDPKISLMFTVAIFFFICFLERNIYHCHRQHLNMLGQKTKHSKKSFKDISLTANRGIYSHLLQENTYILLNNIKNHPDCNRSVYKQKK
jgi:uncharacterized membrane protein